MCGILGLVAKQASGFFQNDVNIFSQMLVANSVRGIDGTGVFGTYGTGSVGWLKVGAHPYALLTSKKFDSWAQAMTRKFDMVVGHNRKATAGSTNNENAHPFIHEHIILVHNGVVMNHKSMAATEVDSHAIAHSIVNKGHEETLATLEGAFALVWFDMKDRTLRLVRNDQRPLFLVETDSQIVFASEGPMLRWLGERNNKTNWEKSEQIEAGTLISISQVGKTILRKKIKLHTFETRHHYGNHSAWPDVTGVNDETIAADVAEEIRDMMADGVVIDSEDPIAQAIRDDMPEMEDEESQEAVIFLNKYKEGTQVLFEPKEMKQWNSGSTKISGYNLEGILRGSKEVVVRASFEGANVYKQVKDLLDCKVLKGKVYGAMVNPVTGAKSLHVMFVQSLMTYRTFNGTLLSADEWVGICDKYRCMRCEAKLKIADVNATSVNNKMLGKPRVFCPKCVATHMSHLPQKQQDQIKAVNERVDLLISVTDKEWDVKGSAHGS